MATIHFLGPYLAGEGMDVWYFVRYNAVLLHRSTVVWVLYAGISTVILLLQLARLQSASPPTVSVSTLRMALGQVDDTVTLTPSSAAKNDPSNPSTLLTYLGNYKDVNVGVGASELLVGDGGGCRGGGGGDGGDGNNSDENTSEKDSAELIRSLLAGFGNDAYILGACTKTQTMRIALKPHASVEQQLEATWHALRAGQILAVAAATAAAATAATATTAADATDAGHSSGFSSASSLDAVVRAVLGSKKAAQKEWRGVETALRANGFETKWALLAAGPLRVDCSDEPESAGMASTKHYPPKKNYLPTIVSGDDRPRASINRSVRRRHPASPTATLIELTPIAATGGYHRRPIHLDGIRRSSHSAAATAAMISGSGGGVVAVKDAFFGSVLPRGFPEAVAPEYIEYQVWDTLQVLCADLRGAVTTQATLIAIGVGSTTANPSNVVFDDMMISLVGAGMTLFIGSVCTSSKSAPYMKLWRVLDTVLSFISACLDMVSGMAPRRRLVLRCCGVTLRSIAGPLGGGARSSLVLHLANYSINPSFLADVASKERNQDRILGLALMTVRFALLVWIGLNFHRAWLVVVFLSALHLVFNALAVRVLRVDSKMLAGGGKASKRV